LNLNFTTSRLFKAISSSLQLASKELVVLFSLSGVDTNNHESMLGFERVDILTVSALSTWKLSRV
jgi:hypothetical protein